MNYMNYNYNYIGHGDADCFLLILTLIAIALNTNVLKLSYSYIGNNRTIFTNWLISEIHNLLIFISIWFLRYKNNSH